MKRGFGFWVLWVLAVLSMSGCAASKQRRDAAVMGGLLGAFVGGGIGAFTDGSHHECGGTAVDAQASQAGLVPWTRGG